MNPRGAVPFLQALREVKHLQVGRLGDSDQQVQQGEDLLTRLTQLAASDKFAAHQALACQKALLELKLCKPVQALTTVLPYVAEGEVGAARWAVHLAAHIYWLEGELDQVHALAHLLSCQVQHRCHCFGHHTSNPVCFFRHVPLQCIACSACSLC